MRLRNTLIVVKNLEKARNFYRELFGLECILDNGGNMILTEGLVLQDAEIWQKFIGQEITAKHNAGELYFVEEDLEKFVEKLEKYYPEVVYLNRITELAAGRKMVRFYDMDGNILEVGTP